MRWANEDQWANAVQSIASDFGIPSNLVLAIIAQESGFVPTASRQETAIGDVSAGLMQILYGTAKGEGYTGELGSPRLLSGLYDPSTNLHYGISYLASQYERTNGYIPETISAYNGGYRPNLGFGAPATKSLTLCLARDATGKCIKTRNVAVGEFGNKPYVDAVLSNYAYFESKNPTVVQEEPLPISQECR